MRHTEFLYLPAGQSAKKNGKKYKLAKTFWIHLPNGNSSQKVREAEIVLSPGKSLSLLASWFGYKLTIPEGWEWDGPSGPTLDTPNNLLPSLVHDALYTLGNQGLLDESCRSYADDVFYQLLRQEGVGWFRAQYYWLGVRVGGGSHFSPSAEANANANVSPGASS